MEEYIATLFFNPLFVEPRDEDDREIVLRTIKLYDIPVAVGFGEFLDSDACEDLEVDDTVPKEADFAVRVSGDSMEPRFANGQVVFIRKQNVLELGQIIIGRLSNKILTIPQSSDYLCCFLIEQMDCRTVYCNTNFAIGFNLTMRRNFGNKPASIAHAIHINLGAHRLHKLHANIHQSNIRPSNIIAIQVQIFRPNA